MEVTVGQVKEVARCTPVTSTTTSWLSSYLLGVGWGTSGLGAVHIEPLGLLGIAHFWATKTLRGGSSWHRESRIGSSP